VKTSFNKFDFPSTLLVDNFSSLAVNPGGLPGFPGGGGGDDGGGSGGDNVSGGGGDGSPGANYGTNLWLGVWAATNGVLSLSLNNTVYSGTGEVIRRQPMA
jgi:hypothetical protein